MKMNDSYLLGKLILIGVFCLLVDTARGQDSLQTVDFSDLPVRSPFESSIIIDNQTVIVPSKKTLEFDIQHRFGTWENGSEDLYGLWAPSNIRLGLGYTPFDNISVGIGVTKFKKLIDLNIKYAILKQSRSGKIPTSITYFGLMGISTLSDDNFIYATDRYSYFHQIIIGRKINDKLSLQIAPSFSHFNFVATEERYGNDQFAFSGMGRFKFSPQSSIIFNVDQPLTKQRLNNPNPNLALGVEIATSGHAFQVFVGNFGAIIPQENHMYNSNDYTENEILIGFNITRLWNF